VSSLAPGNRQLLHARAVRLEWLTVSWNVIEAVVAVGAGHVGEATVSGLHRVGVTKSDPSLHLSSGDTWLTVLAAA
jgi:hypothetical protein